MLLAPTADVVSAAAPSLALALTSAPAAAPLTSAREIAPARSTTNVVPVSAQLTPLSEARHRVQFTASSALREKLERAQSLMRHRNVDGDLTVVVERAVDLLIAKLEKEKLAATSRPRKAAAADGTRASTASKTSAARKNRPQGITAVTRREVVLRDQEQCAYVSPTGERCPSRDFLELDHRHPRALGGSNDASNLRLLCRGHNHLAAEQHFGHEHIACAIRSRQNKQTPPT